jgi:hypothetical protein
VLAPFGLLLGKTLSRPLPDVVMHGDLALIELATLRATRFEQLEGPYSRFKMHHPGPALFYWLAPFYSFGGQRYGALCLGMLVLNGAAFACLLLVPWRLVGQPGLLVAAPASTLLFLHASPHLFWSAWNPEAGILPLAASAACAFALASGRPNFLPAGVFFGCFAAQCHVLFLAPVAAVWLAGLAVACWRRRGTGKWPRAALAAGAAVALLASFPVALEEWRGEPGNLSLILHLKGATQKKAIGLGPAFAAGGAALAESLWAPLGYGGLHRLEAEKEGPAGRLAILLAIPALAAAALAWRRGSPLLFPAAACLLALLAASFWTIGSMSGELHPYLTRFMVPMLPLALVLLGCALVAGRPRTAPWAAAALLSAAAALSFLGCREVWRAPPLGTFLEGGWGTASWGDAVPKILAGLNRQGMSSPYLGLLDSGHWSYAAAIAAQVEKRDGHVLLYEDWEFMFGRAHSRGAHDGLLLLGSAGDQGGSAAVVEASPITASLIPLPPAFGTSGRSCIGAGDEDAELFLRSGFYATERPPNEPPSLWSRFGVSRLSVRLHPGRQHDLSFEASPHEATLPQRVSVALNGRRLAEIEIANGWRTYSVNIPADLVAPVNEIELRYAKSVVPIEISASRDHRSLALRFRSFCFGEKATG